MIHVLSLSHDFHKWFGFIATGDGVHPQRIGERWLLYLTPSAAASGAVRLVRSFSPFSLAY